MCLNEKGQNDAKIVENESRTGQSVISLILQLQTGQRDSGSESTPLLSSGCSNSSQDEKINVKNLNNPYNSVLEESQTSDLDLISLDDESSRYYNIFFFQ